MNFPDYNLEVIELTFPLLAVVDLYTFPLIGVSRDISNYFRGSSLEKRLGNTGNEQC
jgi:hypothetical protein